MIQIDSETGAKIDRMLELKAICNEMFTAFDRGMCSPEEMREKSDKFCEVQAELVEEFMPLITKLVRAGLITVGMNMPEDVEEGYLVAGEAMRVFENGNIWIKTTEVSSKCKMNQDVD